MDVREIVHETTEKQIHIEEQSDHYKIFINELRPFEIELLQNELVEQDYAAWRFNNNGVRFLKVPK